ncbi:hypothetical protein RUND412_009512 [Rhizina undulata]
MSRLYSYDPMHVSPRYESLFHHTRRIIDIEDPSKLGSDYSVKCIWPETLQSVKLLNLQKWDHEDCELFLNSLVEARPHLKSLQGLWLNCAIPGLPDGGWRERAMVRDTWRAKILQEFTQPDDYIEVAANSSGPSSLAKAAPNSNDGKRKRGRTAKVTEIQKPGSRRLAETAVNSCEKGGCRKEKISINFGSFGTSRTEGKRPRVGL